MSEMDRLRAIMERLRGPDGCPWDREQTLASLRTYVVEEAYEVVEAIAAEDLVGLREELGDLLFQIVFQARVAEERGAFDLDDVMRGIGDKITRRHPHVFGGGALDTADQVLAQWEQIKAGERRARGGGSLFGGVPAALPALLKALRVSAKAARVGFDWPDMDGLLLKLEEETDEMRAAIRAGDRAGIEEECGDLLFTLANVARRAGFDPEEALQAAVRKFMARFRRVEEGLAAAGLEPKEEHRDRMEALWRAAKEEEKKAGARAPEPRRARRTSPARTSPSAGTSGSASRRGRRPARP